MMRRFSRRRRGGSGDGAGTPIDAARWLGRITEEGVVADVTLTPDESGDVPASVAIVGRGKRADGSEVLVGFSPHDGLQAMAGALVAAHRAVETDGFSGEVLAVAPQWSIAARRALGWMAETPWRFTAIGASALVDGRLTIDAERLPPPPAASPAQLAARLDERDGRDLFLRAVAALEGLASKHGGAVRTSGQGVELVLMARRVAELVIEDGGVALRILQPQRMTMRVSNAELASVFDGLEGQLRRRLNDRRTRDGEEGLRAKTVASLVQARGLRSPRPWPLAGRDEEPLDLLAVTPEGQPLIVAVRKEFRLADACAVLAASQLLEDTLPMRLIDVGSPLKLRPVGLLWAAERFEPGVARLLAGLAVPYELMEVRGVGEASAELSEIGRGEGQSMRRSRRDRMGRRGGASDEGPEEAAVETGEAEAVDVEARGDDDDDAGPGEARRRGRRRGRRSRGGRRGDGPSDASSDGDGDAAVAFDDDADGEARAARGRRGGRGRDGREGGADEESDSGRPRPRFESLSLFDIDEDGRGDREESEEAGSRRRGRGRRRGGRRRSGGEDAPSGEVPSPEVGSSAEEDGEESARGGRGRRRGRRRGRGREEDGEAEPLEAPEVSGREADFVDGEDGEDGDEVDEDTLLSTIPEEIEDLDAGPDVSYDDEEDDDDDDPESAARKLDREKRRRARKGGRGGAPEPVAAPEPEKAPPRKRSVILAHADRDSIMAGILLARDIRLLEGFYVYPQSELMTFFRSVATDLRDDTPIYVIGFSPRPAVGVLQAVSLYRGRLTWFDHHDWPPEDEMAMKSTLGEDALHRAPGAETSLPLVLEVSTRRSRFSDKLADLSTGRFTQHDFERWGRLWLWRLSKVAEQTGDVRAEINGLLVGRPSELAKEASSLAVPPIPPEVAFVSERDFRLVHFGVHTLVVVCVGEDCDINLAARIARERYSATLSLGYTEGQEQMVLGGEEATGKRALDYGAMAEHLSSKLDWVDPLPDADHVARFRVRGLADHPERLDDVIGEIAMGRSILER